MGMLSKIRAMPRTSRWPACLPELLARIGTRSATGRLLARNLPRWRATQRFRSSFEQGGDVVRSRRSWVEWRQIACLALGLAATGSALAQQDDGQKRVTT